MNSLNILAHIITGSKLYGLDGPTSDEDHKMIHLPSREDCFLMRAERTKSWKDAASNAEFESWSLQAFLHNASRGESLAIDMLHAPDDKILKDSVVWRHLRENRSKFYTKNMVGSIQFAISMAAKYSTRAERYDVAGQVLETIERGMADGAEKIADIWCLLPDLPHTSKDVEPLNRSLDKRYYQVCGKKLPAPTRLAYAAQIIEALIGSFGERVKRASELEGSDLKALSHAFRVALELKHLYVEGDITFPIAETPWLRRLKFGELDYVKDGVGEKLDALLVEVQELAKASKFVESVDRAWVDGVVLRAYEN